MPTNVRVGGKDMSFLFGAIFELLWILIKGFFYLEYVMLCEFVKWIFEICVSHPLISFPIVILVVIGIINSIRSSIHERRHRKDLEKALAKLRERRERRELM